MTLSPTLWTLLVTANGQDDHDHTPVEGGFVCGVFDDHDTSCLNIYACAAVMVDHAHELTADNLCDTMNPAGACAVEVDSLNRGHGHCVSAEGGHDHTRRLNVHHHEGVSACASHSHSKSACKHPESKHLCEWDDSASPSERCYLAVGSRGMMRIDEEHDHSGDEAVFCGVFTSGDECLSSKSHGHCIWEQHCEAVSDACDVSEDFCSANPICILKAHGEHNHCELEALEKDFYTSKWLSALTVLIVTCIGIAVPWIGEAFFNRCYVHVRPYLETASSSVLFSMAIIHLLSESQIYSGDIAMVGVFNPWCLFGISVIGTLIIQYVCDFMANQGEGLDHQHDNLLKPAKSVKVLAIMYVAIMIHGVQEGVVLGIQNSELTWTMTTVMLLHKILFTITISQSLKANPSKVHWALVMCFALSTPVAIVVSAYSIETTDDELFAYLNAFSAGTLLVFGLETYLDLPSSCSSDHHHRLEHVSEAVKKSDYLDGVEKVDSMSPSSSEEFVDAAPSGLLEAQAHDGNACDKDITPHGPHGPHGGVIVKETSVKKIAITLVGHFIVTIAVGLMVFGLMVWHLSVHDHEHGAGGHEGHDH